MADKPKTQNTLSAQEEQKEQPAQDEARAKRLAAFRAALDPNSPEYRPDLAQAIKSAAKASQSIAAKVAANSDLIKATTESAEMQDSLKRAAEFWQELKTLEPFIIAELAKDPDGTTWEFLINTCTVAELAELARDPGSAFAQALEAARATAGNEAAPLLKVNYKSGTELKTSTDKLGNLFYSLSAPTNKHVLDGQREILSIPREELTELKYESNDKKQITLFYDFLPNESQLKKIGLTSKFDSYDFFISAVTDNLYLNGNSTVSLSKIWHELGNTTSPNTTQLTELYKRLVRGATTIVTIDDSEVQKAWKNDTTTTYKEIISPVMPLQILGEKFISNGNIANARIIITGLSPFFALSQSIGHYTTWKKEVLQLYTGRKTSRYYSIMQFLMAQIAWIRNPNSKRSNKITYKSVYEYIGDTSTRGKQLSRDMVYRLLDEVFIPAKYIKSYKEDSTGEPGVKINCVPIQLALPPIKKPKK